MAMSEKIKILCIKRKISVSELARKLVTTPQNLSNKIVRDNFSEKELLEIAEKLDCELVINFKMKDRNDII